MALNNVTGQNFNPGDQTAGTGDPGNFQDVLVAQQTPASTSWTGRPAQRQDDIEASFFDGETGQTVRVVQPLWKDDNWNLGGYFTLDRSGNRVNIDAWSPAAAGGGRGRETVLNMINNGTIDPGNVTVTQTHERQFGGDGGQYWIPTGRSTYQDGVSLFHAQRQAQIPTDPDRTIRPGDNADFAKGYRDAAFGNTVMNIYGGVQTVLGIAGSFSGAMSNARVNGRGNFDVVNPNTGQRLRVTSNPRTGGINGTIYDSSGRPLASQTTVGRDFNQTITVTPNATNVRPNPNPGGLVRTTPQNTVTPGAVVTERPLTVAGTPVTIRSEMVGGTANFTANYGGRQVPLPGATNFDQASQQVTSRAQQGDLPGITASGPVVTDSTLNLSSGGRNYQFTVRNTETNGQSGYTVHYRIGGQDQAFRLDGARNLSEASQQVTNAFDNGSLPGIASGGPVVTDSPLTLSRGGQNFSATIRNTQDNGQSLYTVRYRIGGQDREYSLPGARNLSEANQQVTNALNSGNLPGISSYAQSPLTLTAGGKSYSVIIHNTQIGTQPNYTVSYRIGGQDHIFSIPGARNLPDASRQVTDAFSNGNLPGLTQPQPTGSVGAMSANDTPQPSLTQQELDSAVDLTQRFPTLQEARAYAETRPETEIFSYTDSPGQTGDETVYFRGGQAAGTSATQLGFGSNPALREGAQELVNRYNALMAEGRVQDANSIASVVAAVQDKIENSPNQLIIAYEGTADAPRVTGVLSYETTTFGEKSIEVDGMLVDPSAQGSGVGTRLLQEAWDRIWPGTQDKVISLVSVPSAVGFYQNLGGQVRERPGAWPVVEFRQRPGQENSGNTGDIQSRRDYPDIQGVYTPGTSGMQPSDGWRASHVTPELETEIVRQFEEAGVSFEEAKFTPPLPGFPISRDYTQRSNTIVSELAQRIRGARENGQPLDLNDVLRDLGAERMALTPDDALNPHHFGALRTEREIVVNQESGPSYTISPYANRLGNTFIGSGEDNPGYSAYGGRALELAQNQVQNSPRSPRSHFTDGAYFFTAETQVGGESIALTQTVVMNNLTYGSWAQPYGSDVEKLMPAMSERFRDAQTASTPEQALDATARMAWLYYQASPYVRGSASIGQWLVTSTLESHGITYSNLSPGGALDLEAFTSTEADFVRNFRNFFVNLEQNGQPLNPRSQGNGDITSQRDYPDIQNVYTPGSTPPSDPVGLAGYVNGLSPSDLQALLNTPQANEYRIVLRHSTELAGAPYRTNMGITPEQHAVLSGNLTALRDAWSALSPTTTTQDIAAGPDLPRTVSPAEARELLLSDGVAPDLVEDYLQQSNGLISYWPNDQIAGLPTDLYSQGQARGNPDPAAFGNALSGPLYPLPNGGFLVSPRLPSNTQLFVFGDIHGTSNLYSAIQAKAEELTAQGRQQNGDDLHTVIASIGDLGNKGPDTADVAEGLLAQTERFADDPNTDFLIFSGNHEDPATYGTLLDVNADVSNAKVREAIQDIMKKGGYLTLQSFERRAVASGEQGFSVDIMNPPNPAEASSVPYYRQLQQDVARIVPQDYRELALNLPLGRTIGDFFLSHGGGDPRNARFTFGEDTPFQLSPDQDFRWTRLPNVVAGREGDISFNLSEPFYPIFGHTMNIRPGETPFGFDLDTSAFRAWQMAGLYIPPNGRGEVQVVIARQTDGPGREVEVRVMPLETALEEGLIDTRFDDTNLVPNREEKSDRDLIQRYMNNIRP